MKAVRPSVKIDIEKEIEKMSRIDERSRTKLFREAFGAGGRKI
jgi:hypothetical protein